jgi:hypothetical protein
MVWDNVHTRFDPSRCPNCGTTMRLAKVEPHPVAGALDFERHIFRCEDCDNVSRFVIDRQVHARLSAA